MYTAVLCLCLLVIGVQSASVTDLSSLKQLVTQPKTYTCTPTCGAGQCCVHFYTPVHGRRQLLQPIDLNSPYPGVTTMCKAIPTSGEKCLVRNPGEWCDCATGLTCQPNGKIGLDAYFGTCI